MVLMADGTSVSSPVYFVCNVYRELLVEYSLWYFRELKTCLTERIWQGDDVVWQVPELRQKLGWDDNERRRA